MVSPIPKFVQNIWEKWNIRGVILFSLTLQTFLILFAPFRKRTHRSWAVWSIWSAYLLADWAANFCIGLIAKIPLQNTITPKESLMAFWGPFLLLHLGGPDTISAFSLEDNELWLRHLLALFIQAVAAFYVFLLTVPGNTLWIPTILMFLAGLIKYGERIRALHLSSMNNFRRSIVRVPDPGPNYAKLMEEQFSRTEAGLPTKIEIMPEPDLKHEANGLEEGTATDTGTAQGNNNIQAVNDAHEFFDKYKGLIVDMIFSFGERNETRDKFLKKSADDALRVIEVELNYIYEVFYTKVSVVRNKVGYFFRFVSFGCIVASVGLFISKDKNGFHQFDVAVTYTLLYAAVALDAIGLLLLFFSDRTVVSSHETQKKFTLKITNFVNYVLQHFLNLRKPRWSECKKGHYKSYMVLSTPFLSRRWSGTISGYNLIAYCLRQCSSHNPNLESQGFTKFQAIQLFWFRARRVLNSAFHKVVHFFGVTELLESRHTVDNPFLQRLWEFIMEELKRKSKDANDVETTQRICSQRGLGVLKKLMPSEKTDEVTFDASIIMWHIGTHLCYATDQHAHEETIKEKREFSKLLSDYMLYLLVMQPTMMSVVAGIGQIRFQDTCAEAIKFFSKRDLKPQDQEEEKRDLEFQDHEKEKRPDMKKKERVERAACRLLLGVPAGVAPSDVKGDRSKSLLFDGVRLAKVLIDLEGKWEVMSEVWVEILSYAACNCRPIAFVQQLSKGGELISVVWLLMVHLGLGKQFQIKEGHARAKLIVSK